jgi:hypothetical protein
MEIAHSAIKWDPQDDAFGKPKSDENTNDDAFGKTH